MFLRTVDNTRGLRAYQQFAQACRAYPARHACNAEYRVCTPTRCRIPSLPNTRGRIVHLATGKGWLGAVYDGKRIKAIRGDVARGTGKRRVEKDRKRIGAVCSRFTIGIKKRRAACKANSSKELTRKTENKRNFRVAKPEGQNRIDNPYNETRFI